MGVRRKRLPLLTTIRWFSICGSILARYVRTKRRAICPSFRTCLRISNRSRANQFRYASPARKADARARALAHSEDMPFPVPGRVAEALRQSTVQITSVGSRAQGNGSGAVVAPEQIVTNAHVVAGDRLTVESWEGKNIRATLIKLDRRRDLALLGVPGLNGTPVTLGDSHLLRAGTPVFAVGNPLGFVGALSSGVVHRVGPMRFRGSPGRDTDWICSDLRLAPGNSGGPLADYRGHVVGINTMIAAGGLAFAVSSRTLQGFLQRSAQPDTLGVTVRPVQFPDKRSGLLILELARQGPAETASLLPGDILTAANKRALESPEDLADAIEETSTGLLELTFYRGRHDMPRCVAVRLASSRRAAA